MAEFGFRTGSFRGWPIEKAAAEIKRLGFDCLELCLEASDVRPEKLDQARCLEIRRTLDDLGIGLASVSYHGDRDDYGERRANQERAVAVSGWLGAKYLILNAEKTSERERQWAGHVERLKKLCRLADAVDVTIAFEPEPLLVVGSSAEMQEMISEVGSPRLGVNLDVGHAQITDPDLAAAVRDLGSAVVHLHLEDIKDRVHKHLPFGEGNIDFPALRAALADIAYQGPYVVDLFGLDDPSTSAAAALAGMRARFA